MNGGVYVKLSDLDIGSRAFVKSIFTDSLIRRRLLDIGLIPNTLVECLYKSPLGKMKAYLIRDSVIAIRDLDAKLIEVDLCD